MELSSQEVGKLTRFIQSELKAYYVNKVSQLGERAIVLRFHKSEAPDEFLVLAPGLATWMSEKSLPLSSPEGFYRRAGALLERSSLKRIEQLRSERVVSMHFEDHSEFSLVCELFGEGNLALLDHENKILDILHPISVRHRTLRKGLIYVEPPRRALPPESNTISAIDLDQGLTMAQVLGRRLFLPKKYTEEALKRCGIDPKSPSIEVKEDQLHRIRSKVRCVLDQVERSEVGYVYFEGPKPIEIAPIKLTMPSSLQERFFDLFNNAVDAAFSWLLLNEVREEDAATHFSEINRYNESLREQENALNRALETYLYLKNVADSLLSEEDSEDLKAVLENASNGRITILRESQRTWVVKVNDLESEIEKPVSLPALASRLYDLAKSYSRRASSIRRSQAVLEGKLRTLAQDATLKAAVVQERTSRRHWYESYRWFHTSESMLAVGGRDASSNLNLIKRHLEPADLAFHADIHGSPLFVLKGGESASELGIYETAQATVCFSRVWKDVLSSADAYYVKPNQISLTPPSGMFLPRGSFMVFGEKIFARDVKLELAIGLITEPEIRIISGPVSSVENVAQSYLRLVPSREKVSESAKLIKAKLYSKVAIADRQMVKQITIDDIIRMLPSGGCKVLE